MAALLKFIALASLLPSLVTSLPSQYQVKERLVVPNGWSKVSEAPKNGFVSLQIALKQGNFAQLEKELYEVSDPSHIRYGQYLSLEEVQRLVRPSDEAQEKVNKWLQSMGVTTITQNTAGDVLTLQLSIHDAEKLLDTKYAVYRNIHDGTKLLRTTEYALPRALHEHIDSIHPTTTFARLQRQLLQIENHQFSTIVSSKAINSTICDGRNVTPLCLRNFYGTINYVPQATQKNYMALPDFAGEVNNRSDARIFLQNYRPEAVKAADEFQQVSIADGTLQQTPNNETQLESGTGREGNLDAQTMLGVAWPTNLTIWSTGGVDPDFIPDDFAPTNSNEPFAVWLQYILALPELPSVISISYADDEQTVAKPYAQHVCHQFAQLSARGVSVFAGSGV